MYKVLGHRVKILRWSFFFRAGVFHLKIYQGRNFASVECKGLKLSLQNNSNKEYSFWQIICTLRYPLLAQLPDMTVGPASQLLCYKTSVGAEQMGLMTWQDLMHSSIQSKELQGQFESGHLIRQSFDTSLLFLLRSRPTFLSREIFMWPLIAKPSAGKIKRIDEPGRKGWKKRGKITKKDFREQKRLTGRSNLF